MLEERSCVGVMFWGFCLAVGPWCFGLQFMLSTSLRSSDKHNNMSKVKWAARQMGASWIVLLCVPMGKFAGLCCLCLAVRLARSACAGAMVTIRYMPLLYMWGTLSPWLLFNTMEIGRRNGKQRGKFSLCIVFCIHMVLNFSFATRAKPCQSLKLFYTKERAAK